VLHRSFWSMMSVLAFSGLLLPLRSQTSTSSEHQNQVFKTSARLVVLDVVVTGKNHKPLTGLQQQDFLVSEDGTRQTIKNFEEHTAAEPLQVTSPELPPNMFTNVPRVKPNGSVTVMVLDSLNTPLDDQRFVHAQVLKYIKKPEPGQRVAIFTLQSRLRMIQGFTDDPSLLAAAVNDKKNGVGRQVPQLMQSDAETAATQETEAALMVWAPEAAADMQQFAAEEGSDRSNVRLRETLQAFQDLAHYLAGFPGRKNVVWFSGAFPVAILPDPTLIHEFGAQRDDQEEIRKTSALLTAAQIAIYPVGAEGLTTNPTYNAGADSRLVQQSQLSQPQVVTKELNANHAAMDVIAKATGGEAFYSTNDLNDALQRILAHGSNFYTLTYTSTNPATDGKFRRIDVKLVRPGYQLDYRRGYYADTAKTAASPSPAPPPNADLLSAFLHPGSPDSTEVPLTLRVVPTKISAKASAVAAIKGDNPGLKEAVNRYAVDLMIPARGLQFDTAADGHRHVRLQAGLFLFTRDGRLANWLLRQVNLNLDDAHYAIVQADGINLYFEIDGPADSVSLRGGVYDKNSDLAGTVIVPLKNLVSPAPSSTGF